MAGLGVLRTSARAARVRQTWETGGLSSLGSWAARWLYWNSGLYRTGLHLRPPLQDMLYLNPLDHTLKGREIILKVLLKQGARYRVVRIDDLKFKLDLHDEVISQKLFLYREWERFESALFLRALRPGMTVLDVGAHIGYYALHAAKVVGRGGRVLAFEPVNQNFALLEANVRLNALGSVLEPVQAAVSDHAHTLTMQLSDLNSGDHRVYATTRGDDALFHQSQPRAAQPVQAIVIDEFLSQQQIAQVDVIKMDVQGAEMQALNGMRATLRRNANIMLFFEYWQFGLQAAGTAPRAPLDFLESLGLALWRIDTAAKELEPVTANELAAWAAGLDPYEQVDVIAARSQDAVVRLMTPPLAAGGASPS